MLKQADKNPESLFQLYRFIEQLIEMNSNYDESEEVDRQIDFLLRSEQDVIDELAETSSHSVADLKHKISILFGETGICGRSGDKLLPFERLAKSILSDLDNLTITEVPETRLTGTA